MLEDRELIAPSISVLSTGFFNVEFSGPESTAILSRKHTGRLVAFTKRCFAMIDKSTTTSMSEEGSDPNSIEFVSLASAYFFSTANARLVDCSPKRNFSVRSLATGTFLG